MDEHNNIANYRRIERAISYLEANFKKQPSLEAIAASAGLSKYHFQRLFKSFAGITPTQFLHFLTVNYAKTCLAESRSVFASALESGLSGSGRLHDMFINIEAMSPGEYKALGQGVKIFYGTHSTPFGSAFLAATDRGLCAFRFLLEDKDGDKFLKEIKSEWANASFQENAKVTKEIIAKIFNRKTVRKKITLLVKGTNFQVKVWQALLKVPEGNLVSYEDLAAWIGKPSATRAVANVVAKNPIAYLIPCHRVIRKGGSMHAYRWGAIRKKIMIGYEAAQSLKEG